MTATCNIPDKYEVTWDQEKRMREPGERGEEGRKRCEEIKEGRRNRGEKRVRGIR